MLLRCFSEPRLSTYLDHCAGDLEAALMLYDWNTALAGAAWEILTHVEIALRNALADGMHRRHENRRRAESWLDNPAQELDQKAVRDIEIARRRVQTSRHEPSDAQTVSQLSFGFWRFLLARRYTNLWPDLASGFPHAPNRSRATIEEPVERLHTFRNRVAHHERIWHEPVAARYTDMVTVLGYIDPDLAAWADAGARLPSVLASRPT